jgi:F-type H+-transporting ATPase subunit delta
VSVAKSYARALLGSAQDLRLSVAEIDGVERELAQLEELLASSRDLRVALLAPITSLRAKSALVESLAEKAKFSKLVRQFLLLLVKKDRLQILRGLRSEFRVARLEADGGVMGSIVSAEPIGRDDEDTLVAAFAKKLGKKVAFETSVDPSLLAGMKVTVNGVTYDGSLKGQLSRLRRRLAQGRQLVHEN